MDYPYIEWYSENSRVVLEPDPSRLEIVESAPVKEKSRGYLRQTNRGALQPWKLFWAHWRPRFPGRTASMVETATFPAYWWNEGAVGAVAPRCVGGQGGFPD